MLKLVIGNKNYSSWSLRAWLFLRENKIPFEEIRIPLFTGDWRSQLDRYTPAGRVPVLIHGDSAVWDSLAILEHVLETHPEAMGWPSSARARCQARSVATEMHSGFLAVRAELPQNIRARGHRRPEDLSRDCQRQIARIERIWTTCRRAHADTGPWLFGEFSIADVMFAPVALRFLTYSIPVGPETQGFIRAIQDLASVQEWIQQSEAEAERLDFIDNLSVAEDSPLTPG